MALYKFDHGDELKEQVTGVVGVVTGRSDFFNGCKRYLIETIAKGKKIRRTLVR